MNRNQLSFALNIVLVIAVAVLYYLHFSSSKTCAGVDPVAGDSTALAKPHVLMPKEIKASKIVYVNTDVINEKFEYIRDLSNVARTKQESFENVYKRKAKDLQDRYQDFQQKGSQGLLSENQTRQAQEELAKGKAELDQMEATHQQMMEEMQIDNEKALKMLTDYIKDYNKSSQYNYILSYSSSPMSAVLGVNDSLDITNEIIEGLNLQYRAKKGK